MDWTAGEELMITVRGPGSMLALRPRSVVQRRSAGLSCCLKRI